MNYAVLTILTGLGAAVALLCALVGIPGRRLWPALFSLYVGVVWGAAAGVVLRWNLGPGSGQADLGLSPWSLEFPDGATVVGGIVLGLLIALGVQLVLVALCALIAWLRGIEGEGPGAGVDEDDDADQRAGDIARDGESRYVDGDIDPDLAEDARPWEDDLYQEDRFGVRPDEPISGPRDGVRGHGRASRGGW